MASVKRITAIEDGALPFTLRAKYLSPWTHNGYWMRPYLASKAALPLLSQPHDFTRAGCPVC